MFGSDESFPAGITMKLGQKDGRFIVCWQQAGKTHQVEGDSLTVTIREAVQVIQTLQDQGSLL